MFGRLHVTGSRIPMDKTVEVKIIRLVTEVLAKGIQLKGTEYRIIFKMVILVICALGCVTIPNHNLSMVNIP